MFSLRYLKIWVGGAILALLVVCGVAAPLFAPRDPQAQTLEDRLRPPRWIENGLPAYFLGTDNLGPRHVEPDHLWLADFSDGRRGDGDFCRPRRLHSRRDRRLFRQHRRRNRQQDFGNFSGLSVFSHRHRDHGVSRPRRRQSDHGADAQPLGAVLPGRARRSAVVQRARFCHRGESARRPETSMCCFAMWFPIPSPASR